jgi:hypothetical protein
VDILLNNDYFMTAENVPYIRVRPSVTLVSHNPTKDDPLSQVELYA